MITRDLFAEQHGPFGGYVRPGSAPLVGRADELHLLRDLQERALAGEAQMALVAGEPGVGKSRLLAEMSNRVTAEGWLVLQGGASEAQGLSPYQPLAEALRDYASDSGLTTLRRLAGQAIAPLAWLLPELRPRRGRVQSPDDRGTLFEAVAQTLRRLAARQTLLLVFDDLQWADPAFLSLLVYLRRRLRQARLLILAGHRAPEGAAGDGLAEALAELNRLRATALRLNPLDESESEGLLAGLLPGGAAARLAEAVYRASGGNAFFVEEIVRGLMEASRLVRRAGGWDLADDAETLLSPRLRDALRARFQRLPAEMLDLLRALAVLGRRARLDDLARMEGMSLEAVQEQIPPAVERHLVRRVFLDEVEFSHDTVREALYLDLEPVQRRRLHQRAGDILRDHPGTGAAEVAYHLLRGSNPARALPALWLAGEQALLGGAYQQAETQLEAGIAILRQTDPGLTFEEPIEPLSEWLLKLADAQVSAGQYERALASLGEILAQPGSPSSAAVYERIGSVHLAREEPPAAERAFQQALAAATADSPARARALARLSQLYVSVTGRLDEGERLGEEARALASQRGDGRLEAETLAVLGQAAMHRGDFALGRRRFEQGLALAEALGDPTLSGQASDGLARLSYWTAAFDDLRAVAQRELGLARRGGDPWRLGWPTFWLAQSALQRADWREAQAQADLLIRLGEELGTRRFLAQGHELRGIAALLRGAGEAGVRDLRAAVAHFRAIGPGTLVYYLGPLALALVERDERAEAETVLAELRDLAAAFPLGTSPRVQAFNVVALALLGLGRTDEAAGVRDELLAAERQLHWHLVARTLGRIETASGLWAEATRHLELARDLAQRGNGRVELARVLEAQAGLADRQGQERRAADLWRQAREQCQRCGLPAPAQSATHIRRPAPAHLSVREVEVLRLVVEGLTNREIAERLTISEKTAINHLTHVFAKVGVDNRAAAAAYAIRQGLA